MTVSKIERRIKIKFRIRKKVVGTAERPRLSVFRSNKQIYAQVINDKVGTTLAAASSLGLEKMNKSERNQNPIIILESCDKALIGLICAKIRSFRKPEPYKGKGILFKGEVIRRKSGKSASAK